MNFTNESHERSFKFALAQVQLIGKLVIERFDDHTVYTYHLQPTDMKKFKDVLTKKGLLNCKPANILYDRLFKKEPVKIRVVSSMVQSKDYEELFKDPKDRKVVKDEPKNSKQVKTQVQQI